MLDVAINHVEEIRTKLNSIWFDEKYKFFNNSSYYSDFKADDDTWLRHQFVSLNKEGEVIGLLEYSVNRQTHSCHHFGIINFSDDKMTFGVDLRQVIRDMFDKFKFNKLNFEVVVGNPAEKSYDRMIYKYGGRTVGTLFNDTKLIDGGFYHVKIYEISRIDYIQSFHMNSVRYL